HRLEFVGAEVGDVEQVSHSSTSAMMATASSSSASLTVSGGANRSEVGVTAFVTRPASSNCEYTALASAPSASSAANSNPRPRTPAMPGSAPSFVVKYSPRLAASVGASIRRISSMTALTTAVASAVPLYVLPWSPGRNTAATSCLAQVAP